MLGVILRRVLSLALNHNLFDVYRQSIFLRRGKMADIAIIFFVVLVGCSWSALAQSEGQVRLVGGGSSNEGRVEIYHNGEWGTICHDYWDDVDATVACKQLGYNRALRATDRARFGEGTGRIWLENVDCEGWESTLSSCYHRSWGDTNCNHAEDAGAVCTYDLPYTGDLRLSDGLRLEEGRVEIYYGGVWGTVCNDYWGYNEAKVTCYQLGYSGVTASSIYYEAGTGPIHMDNVMCYGSETKLMYCAHDGWGQTQDCSHYEDVGVRCYREGVGMPGWQIALITMASLVGFGILVALVGMCCNKKKKRRSQDTQGQTDVVYSVTNNVVATTTMQQPTYQVQNAVQPYPPQGMFHAAPPPSYTEAAAAPYPNPAAAPYPNPAVAPYPNPAAAYPPQTVNQAAAGPSSQQNGGDKSVPPS